MQAGGAAMLAGPDTQVCYVPNSVAKSQWLKTTFPSHLCYMQQASAGPLLHVILTKGPRLGSAQDCVCKKAGTWLVKSSGRNDTPLLFTSIGQSKTYVRV